jgi:hypothetical protein
MRAQSASQKNSATRLTPEIKSAMPWRVVQVTALPNFRLHVCFVDGLEGTVNMASRVRAKNAGVFAVLSDPAHFEQVYVEAGAVTWPGEIDLAPDSMHAVIKQRGEWELT